MNPHPTWRSSQITGSIALIMIISVEVKAEYVNRDEILNLTEDTYWLYDATSEGVKAGVESVTKEILTNVGKALVASYSPEFAEILFGTSDEAEQQTQRVLSAIQSIHADLAERIRQLGDDIGDQFDADVVSNYETASLGFDTWLGYSNLLIRWESKAVARHAADHFGHIRTKLQDYIDRGAGARFMYRRLQLLPTHIAASQLEVTANRSYYGVIAIHAAFKESTFGSDDGQFDAWAQTLSAEAIEGIRAAEPNFDRNERTVYREVLSFYERLADRDPIGEYVDSVFTPAVSHMNQFVANRNMFDDPDVVTDNDSWGTSPGAVALLDGIRWYYYVNIPRADCLDGFAYHALTQTGVMPWHEVPGDLAGSNCNRFWFVDPSLASSGWPNSNLASFDNYSIWFDNPVAMYGLHKTLVKGDILRALYGPVSLVLDRMYLEQFGDVRPENRWDLDLAEYDRQIALLGLTESYTDGLSYETVLAAQRFLASYGATDITVGLQDWFRMMKRYVGSPERARNALAGQLLARHLYDWMSDEEAYIGTGLRVPNLRSSLLGPDSVYARFPELSAFEILPHLESEVRCDAAARFVAVR